MKTFNNIFLLIIYCFSQVIYADEISTNDAITAQSDACNKNSSTEWSTELNRCITKLDAKNNRLASIKCDTDYKDLKERAACHTRVAQAQTGLNADVGSLYKGNKGGSAVMNGIGTAYAILGMINKGGSGLSKSTCTSKKIFGITAIVGTLSDIYLKFNANKKTKELENKYQVATNQGAYDSQIKALEYLKDEQQTVVDIANLEKKRNLLLMVGYGAAAVMAIADMVTYGSTNPGCSKPEGSGNTDKTITANADPDKADKIINTAGKITKTLKKVETGVEKITGKKIGN